jgi:hypothetical protein
MPELLQSDLRIVWEKHPDQSIYQAYFDGSLIFRLPPHQALTKEDVDSEVRKIIAVEYEGSESNAKKFATVACRHLSWSISVEHDPARATSSRVIISGFDFHEDDRPERAMQTTKELEAEAAL